MPSERPVHSARGARRLPVGRTAPPANRVLSSLNRRGKLIDFMHPTHPASSPDRNDVRGLPHDSDLLGEVPDRFNFTRDVVEAIAAADPRRNALTFVSADGVIDRLSFAEVAVAANRWSALLRERGPLSGRPITRLCR